MLEGPNVVLRLFKEDDLDEFFALRGTYAERGDFEDAAPVPEAERRKQFSENGWWSESVGRMAITSKDGRLLGSSECRFLVVEQDLELDHAAADATLLESLAAMTGGRSLVPEELSNLIERLAEDTESLKVRTETKKSLWDTWGGFLLLVGLLAAEWYLRKRWGLV